MTGTTDGSSQIGGGCPTSCVETFTQVYRVDSDFEVPYTREFLDGLSKLPKPPDLPCPEDEDL